MKTDPMTFIPDIIEHKYTPTRREYFAIRILQGLVSDHKTIDEISKINKPPEQYLAELAVMQADVLISELEKQK